MQDPAKLAGCLMKTRDRSRPTDAKPTDTFERLQRERILPVEVMRAMCQLEGRYWNEFESIFCESVERSVTNPNSYPLFTDDAKFVAHFARNSEKVREILKLKKSDRSKRNPNLGQNMPPPLEGWLSQLLGHSQLIANGLNHDLYR